MGGRTQGQSGGPLLGRYEPTMNEAVYQWWAGVIRRGPPSHHNHSTLYHRHHHQTHTRTNVCFHTLVSTSELVSLFRLSDWGSYDRGGSIRNYHSSCSEGQEGSNARQSLLSSQKNWLIRVTSQKSVSLIDEFISVPNILRKKIMLLHYSSWLLITYLWWFNFEMNGALLKVTMLNNVLTCLETVLRPSATVLKVVGNASLYLNLICWLNT